MVDIEFFVVPIAASAFIATNLDNLLLLVALLARYQGNRFYVITGYLCCVATLVILGFLIAAAADMAPVQYLGLLGLVPITIGAISLVSLLNGQAVDCNTEKTILGGVGSAFFATYMVQLSNGADTVITLGALFADTVSGANYLIIVTLAVMAVLFGLIAVYAVDHPFLNRWIQKYAPWITPFILIFVGIYILANTATDLLPG